MRASGLVIVAIALLAGCKKLNKEEPRAAYIHLNVPTLTDMDGRDISTTARISDLWLLDEAKLIGTFEYPTTVPLLQYDSLTVSVFGGVRENGISNTRLPYPFFESYGKRIELKAGEVTEIRPEFKYKANTKVAFQANGEGRDRHLIAGNGNRAAIGRIGGADSLVYAGDSAAIVILNTELNYLEATSTEFLNLPANNPVWLEVVFRSDVFVTVGLDVYYTGQNGIRKSKVVLNSSPDEWNRVYINFTNEVSEEAGQKVLFKPFFIATLGEGQTSGRILLDNVRILHFE